MRRVVWLAILLIGAIGFIAQAEMTVNTGANPLADPLTPNTTTGTDNHISSYIQGASNQQGWIFRTQATMELQNRSSTTRIYLPFMRFDLRDIAGRHLNDAILKFNLWSNNGVSRTYDVWGLNDTGTSTAINGDMWDASTLSFTLASTPAASAGLEWLTPYPDLTGTYGSFSMNTALWTRLGTIRFTVSANGTVSVTSDVAHLNMNAFMAADTNKLVTLTITPFYNGNNWHGVTSFDSGSNYPTLTFPHAYPLGASNPVPAEGKKITNLNMSQLSWNNYGINKYELWFGPVDANEVTYKTLLSKVGTFDVADKAQEVITTNLPSEVLPLTMPQLYTWAVAGYILDPNGFYTTEPNTVSAWHFETTTKPVMITNPTEQHKFVTETSVFSAQFECALPLTSVKWYKEAGATDIEMSSANVTVTNDGAFTYTTTLTLSNVTAADDGQYYCVAQSAGGSDTTAQIKLVIKRLLAHYALDGNAADSSPNGNNATLYGEPNFLAGKIGQAMQFVSNGTNLDYVGLPNAFTTFTPGLTFSVWAKPVAATSYARFLDLGDTPPALPASAANNNVMFYRYGTGNMVVFEIYNGATSVCYVRTAEVLTLNEWQLLVVTMDETGNVVLYRNGLSVATGTGTKPVDASRVSSYIGKSNWSTDAMYNGFMDDISIYNYGLTADEASHLYADINGDYCRNRPTYDYSGDCKMNLSDFATFAAQWLGCGLWPACP
jgi:hypothetical protein